MPRQDVPYGGAICRLRERIAEIFDKLGEKLHTINGVPGDGDGNVKIVSGSSAVVISNDPTQNEIAVSLDTSQLPAASVASVNGQTGAVALDAGDIPSDGNSDVQSDIDALQTMDGALQGNINAEALARQGADATLQTNINTLSASLPSAAAAAVAADPTVAQLVTDMAGKVDLTDVSTVETPNTIAKRNGSGRLVAADPASGATDKTLTTANWISQSGDSAPNNLAHRNGDETFKGAKDISNLRSCYVAARSVTFDSSKPWVLVGYCDSLPNNNMRSKWIIYDNAPRPGASTNQNQSCMFRLRYSKTSAGIPYVFVNIVYKEYTGSEKLIVCINNGRFEIYWKQTNSTLDFCIMNAIYSIHDDWVWIGETNQSTTYADSDLPATYTVIV